MSPVIPFPPTRSPQAIAADPAVNAFVMANAGSRPVRRTYSRSSGSAFRTAPNPPSRAMAAVSDNCELNPLSTCFFVGGAPVL